MRSEREIMCRLCELRLGCLKWFFQFLHRTKTRREIFHSPTSQFCCMGKFHSKIAVFPLRGRMEKFTEEKKSINFVCSASAVHLPIYNSQFRLLCVFIIVNSTFLAPRGDQQCEMLNEISPTIQIAATLLYLTSTQPPTHTHIRLEIPRRWCFVVSPEH